MRGIVIDPGKAPQIVRMPDDGQALERWLGGDALLRVHPAKPAALLYTMRKSNLIRDCDLPGVPGYTRIWRGSRYYGRLLLIGWRRGKPASLPKDLAEELAREWATEEVL